MKNNNISITNKCFRILLRNLLGIKSIKKWTNIFVEFIKQPQIYIIYLNFYLQFQAA